MNRLSSVLCVLAVALIELVGGSEAAAEEPPALPRGAALDPTKPPPPAEELLNAPRSEVDLGSPSPSTRLEVPAGSDIKITIEVSGKSKPPPLPSTVATEPDAAEVKKLLDALRGPPPPTGATGPDAAEVKKQLDALRGPPPPTVATGPAAPGNSRIPATDPIWDLARIKPEPLPPIPHDPPPHEGAMVELPYVAEPPDLIRVEVLHPLPGRPISGERLIRPDGMISLGFFGDIYVRGLTLPQIKHKLVVHLRKFLPDEKLGLLAQDEEGKWQDVKPQDSSTVFVDVSQAHSKTYYVQGDVGFPGKVPWTANETVLDALNHAKGFLKTADPKNIRLVRPGRAGKPARVYKVDYAAILERGEIEQNYQLLPGDRLIVGRDPIVQTTLEIDRIAAPIQTILNTMLQHSYAVRGLTQSLYGDPSAATPAQREALVKEWADFWWRIVERPPAAELDEKTFREALMRTLTPPKAKKPGKKK